ncbi:NADH-quinone oxidoreductase subunit J [Arenimonas sp. GDDSR-1]|uniref:NADH-quinone oxidoreductase subunit J n=1 Tax=Arenimonas sp. GDDSR-1 TaxID=2950125 RepID=UPI00261EE908|nr:NADH-quinone oxidoreductase subunit J [Arenimonas sp. GDDSR-1]
MNFEMIAFYLFAAVALSSAVAVISFRNPVHSVLSLVLTFFSTACLWLLLQAEFLGIVLVLVYIGAVMILFLFVVMMLDVHTAPQREGFIKHFPAAIAVAGVMFAEILLLLGVGRGAARAMPAADPALLANDSNLHWIAQALFSRYMLPFETAAVILTVAVVVAVPLTLRRRAGTKTQNPSEQVLVRRDDRVRLVKMAATVKTDDGAPEAK